MRKCLLLTCYCIALFCLNSFGKQHLSLLNLTTTNNAPVVFHIKDFYGVNTYTTDQILALRHGTYVIEVTTVAPLAPSVIYSLKISIEPKQEIHLAYDPIQGMVITKKCFYKGKLNAAKFLEIPGRLSTTVMGDNKLQQYKDSVAELDDATDKFLMLKDIVISHYITTDQLISLIDGLDNDFFKSRLAKFAHLKVTDQENFGEVYNEIQSSYYKNLLSEYLETAQLIAFE